MLLCKVRADDYTAGMSASPFKIGLVQHACTEDKDENVATALAGVEQAARRGARLVCLPELFASPYFCQVDDPGFFSWAEALDGPTATAAAAAAKQHQVTLLASIFERRGPGVYHNTLLTFGPDGSQLGVYRKMHIPDDPQFREKFYFTPGDLGYQAIPTPGCVAGPLVCWDQWYPEAARLTAMAGAQVLFYPTAIGWLEEEKAEHGADQLSAWQTIQRSHAIANGVFTVSVNRVGVESSKAGDIEFWGHSFVCAPSGRIIAEAGENEEVLVVECDFEHIEATRQIWPFFRDRRIETYSGLTKRWGS
jgi:N-carbamoylputrescine amidase